MVKLIVYIHTYILKHMFLICIVFFTNPVYNDDKMSIVIDEIGYWSEIKLEIIEKYARAYSQILSKQTWAHHIYVDAFASSGTHRSKTKKVLVKGSPQIALDIVPPFKEYFFIDINKHKVDELKRITSLRGNSSAIHIFQGDCNIALLEQIFPMISKPNMRTLCLLDPYSLNLDWQVIETAGKMRTVEIFLNFPVMDMTRNALLSDQSKITDDNARRMDAFWGDSSWRSIAFHNFKDLFGEDRSIKQHISLITQAFRDRLIKQAGFKFVPVPIPMRNSKSSLLYYLFFASNNPTGEKIISEILGKYRERGVR